MGWIQNACMIVGMSAAIINPISGGMDAFLNPKNLYDFAKNAPTSQVRMADYDATTRIGNAIIGILHGTDNGGGIDSFEDLVKQKTAQQDALENLNLNNNQITTSAPPLKTPKRYKLDHEKTIEKMRKAMPEGSKEYFDNALKAGQNNKVRLLPNDSTVYLSGSNASGNFVSPTSPGLNSREIMENYQLPASNRADVVREMRTTRPQLAIESNVAPQPEWARQAGYEARTGNKQLFIPNSNVEGAVADGRLREVGRENTDYNNRLSIAIEAQNANKDLTNGKAEETNQPLDFEKKQQAIDDKYNKQLEDANNKYDDKVHTADENYNSKADRINNAPLTDKEKERANSKYIAENYDDKRDANHERLKGKDDIADRRHDEKQNNIDEQYKNDVAQNYDNHQKEQDKINQDYADKDKAIDNKYDSKESELRDRTNKDLSSELESDENKAKFAQNKSEHEDNVNNINSEYDKNAENIKGEYADYKNNTEKQNEMNGRLNENEEGRKTALEKEDANYRDKDKGVINDTEAMKNYNEEHNKNEADRKNEKAENAQDCSDRMKDNDKNLEKNNGEAKNLHDSRTAENDVNLNKEKQNNAEEANKAKEENVADREEKQARTKAPEQEQSTGQSQGQGYYL